MFIYVINTSTSSSAMTKGNVEGVDVELKSIAARLYGRIRGAECYK